MGTFVNRKRCELCLAILSVESTSSTGEISSVVSPVHTQSSCATATLARIRVLEDMHVRDSYRIESDGKMVEDLGEWIGVTAGIIAAGRRWLEHRDKRAADIAVLRKTFGTNERTNQHPLWQAEEEVACAIQAAIVVVETRSKS